MDSSFNIEIGDITNLSGNAVIYWKVENTETNTNPPIEILAINFVISVFLLDDNLVTATFPPVAFHDRDEFMLYVKQAHADLIYAGEITLKKDIDYLKTLPDKEYYTLNRLIDKYLEYYRTKIDMPILNLSLKEKIYLLKKLTESARKKINQQKNFIKIPINKGRIQKLAENLKNYFPATDIDHFLNLYPLHGKTIDTILSLYIDKFIAIYYEDYEKAKDITKEIAFFEKKIMQTKNNPIKNK